MSERQQQHANVHTSFLQNFLQRSSVADGEQWKSRLRRFYRCSTKIFGYRFTVAFQQGSVKTKINPAATHVFTTHPL